MPIRIRRPSSAGLVAAGLAALALLLAPATPAAAHNSLQSASPAQDARISTSPTQITLKFLQKLDPAFTTIVLSDTGQRKIPTSEPAVTGTTGTVTISQPLANGTYTVAYRVVSTDGHPVQGSYSFTVADPTADAAGPTASAAPDMAASAAANTGAASSTSPSPAASLRRADSSGPMLLVAGGIAVVAIVAGFVVLRRRRATS